LGAGSDDGIDRLRSKGRGFRRTGQLWVGRAKLLLSISAVGGDVRT
ncbi:unnamed protein product, partial [Musa acuminata subsp. burmannicoides]